MDEDKHTIPAWADSLISAGEQFASLAKPSSSGRLTLALCLPCMDYAAAFIGLGILKQRISVPSYASEEERMKSLLGQWVSLSKRSTTVVGILGWCTTDKNFEIQVYKDKTATSLEVIDTKLWPYVRPIGKEFNPSRKLSLHQIQKISEQNSSISSLSLLLDSNLWETTLIKSGSLFRIYGNKSRLMNEISEPLFTHTNAFLSKIIRPEGHRDSGDVFHCVIESKRSAVNDGDDSIVIIEAGNSLADQIAASRKLNRIILLARNSPDYDDCAGRIIDAFSMKTADLTEMSIKAHKSINLVKFYHG